MFRPVLFAAALIAAPAFAQTSSETTMPRAKVVANAEAEFGRVDTNKDGQMSRLEIENFQRAGLTARATARNKAMFAELDADKNGSISAAEFAKATPVPKPDATDVLRIDTDKDGQISLAEHRTATLATFTQVDTNKDGILTTAEVQALATAR